MSEQLTTLGQSTLNGAITTTGATTLVVTSAASFPASGTFRIAVDSEIMKVTGVSGTTFTVVRGDGGTTAATHLTGAPVTEVLTAEALLQFQADTLGIANMLLPMPTDTSITGTVTMTSANRGKMHVCSGTSSNYAVTLEDATVAPAGTLIGFRMATGLTKLVTLTSASGSQIDGLATRIMWAFESCILLNDGAQWHKIAGRAVAMQCIMRLTGDQSAANASVVTVSLNGVDSDNAGLMGDTTNHWIAIQRPSNYLCICKVAWDSLAANSPRLFSLLHNANGSVDLGSCEIGYHYDSPTAGYPSPVFAKTFPLVTGDHIQVAGFQASGSTQNIYGAGTGDVTQLIVQELPNW